MVYKMRYRMSILRLWYGSGNLLSTYSGLAQTYSDLLRPIRILFLFYLIENIRYIIEYNKGSKR